MDLGLVGDSRECEILQAQADHGLGPHVEHVEQTEDYQCGREQLLEVLSYQGDRVLDSEEPMKGCTVREVDHFKEVEAQGRGQLGQEVR